MIDGIHNTYTFTCLPCLGSSHYGSKNCQRPYNHHSYHRAHVCTHAVYSFGQSVCCDWKELNRENYTYSTSLLFACSITIFYWPVINNCVWKSINMRVGACFCECVQIIMDAIDSSLGCEVLQNISDLRRLQMKRHLRE